ncbi:aminotransferase class I/II-fold pyridoxal phosphate-dependent enzyme [Dokdonella immobilis]|uniref:alanine transaminase n=1 Tax=Dokdonella immobilis TaxID=578942 RepID=A0A1I4VIW0_9GAMM|nr:aminotransferase class I/II-fold pyridoxal phosphate-dependent enzyme [Dokdonella immobilis]SFN01142.1 L-aspartate aminotransferase apoenzyme [Dokdonella immobilis]
MPHRPVSTSSRLAEVRYEIRGTLSHRARDLEAEGRRIVRLNIGNPGAFGFEAPKHIRESVTRSLPNSEAYCQQQGLPMAREAIAAQQRMRGSLSVDAERVFIGNGVSELIDLALRALLEAGDEVLVPAPDYPLWTAATILNGGKAVHYPCPAGRGHLPDVEEMAALITPRTRAIVLINPNNPTGATYPRELLGAIVALAERHQLVLLADEIYDGILYDGARFEPLAALAGDVPCLSFGGLSKVHRACGYRVGWFSVSGSRARVVDMLHAFDLLAALRLCGNVPGQWAIEPALQGADTISALTAPGGRLHDSRRAVLEAVERSRFLRVVAPAGALYAFPGVDTALIPDFDDEAFALHLLETEDVLIVPGSSFNVRYRNHFRITLLPRAEVIADVFGRIERALVRTAEVRSTARQVA